MPVLELVTGITPASLFVMYGFLPLLLVIFYLVSPQARVPVLSMASFAFVFMVQWQALPPLLLSILISYLACYLPHRLAVSRRVKTVFLTVAVLANVGIFVLASSLVQLKSLPMLLGSTVYPIMALQGVVACLSGEVVSGEEGISFWDFALECSFFPTLYAGPFSSFRDMDMEKIKNQPLTVSLFLTGIGIFIRGAFKNVVLGRTLWQLFTVLKGFSKGETSLLSSWMLVVTFALAFYFILSGFFDMAKGIGELFGISLRSSFYYPYQGASISDFTYRFHSTLRKVVVNGVYLPLVDESQSVLADIAALLISNMLFGLWFGFTFNYALWGAFLALFLLLEKYVYPKALGKLPTVLGRLYTVVVVLLSFPLITENSFGGTFTLYRNLFSFTGSTIPLYNDKIIYIITSNWFVLLIAAVLSINAIENFSRWLRQTVPKFSRVAQVTVTVVLFILVTAVLV